MRKRMVAGILLTALGGVSVGLGLRAPPGWVQGLLIVGGGILAVAGRMLMGDRG